MRFLSLIRVQENTGKQPSEKMMTEMTRLMGEMKATGQLIDTAGLAPTANGKRVRLRAGKISVVDGPFTETKELEFRIESVNLFNHVNLGNPDSFIGSFDSSGKLNQSGNLGVINSTAYFGADPQRNFQFALKLKF